MTRDQEKAKKRLELLLKVDKEYVRLQENEWGFAKNPCVRSNQIKAMINVFVDELYGKGT